MTNNQAGETNLSILLRSMQPILQTGEYVFCTVEANYNYHDLRPIGLFYEAEGLTLILTREVADANHLPYTAVFGLITLSIHSSLEAVGFLAAVTTRLASHGISVNPVSAYYHDHLFVPIERSAEVMQRLQDWEEGERRKVEGKRQKAKGKKIKEYDRLTV